MERELFKGSAAALVTPMREDGSIDYKALGGMIEFQIGEGTAALIVNGTTGESATLSDREKLQLLGFVLGRADGRIPVIAGTGSNDTAHAVRLSREAYRAGADGLLTVTPYYNKTSQKGLIRHFYAVADQVDCPVLLYNVPSRTGVDIAPETYQKLADHPNIRGVKEAGTDLGKVARTAALCGETFHIYSGNDNLTLPILSLGGMGVISVAANLVPGKMHRLCEAFFNGETGESRRLQLELLELMDAMFWDVNPIPVKTALALAGRCGEFFRLPLTGMEEGQREKLRELLQKSHYVCVTGLS